MTRSVPSGADVITIPSTPSRGFWRPFLPEIVLFVLVSAVYYASNFTISGSVEGSHYSITRAIVEERRFAVDSYWRDFGPLPSAEVTLVETARPWTREAILTVWPK